MNFMDEWQVWDNNTEEKIMNMVEIFKKYGIYSRKLIKNSWGGRWDYTKSMA